MVLEKIKEILARSLDVDIETLSADTKIAEDLGADSLDIVEILMDIESEYGIEIPDEDIESIKTIGDAAEYIQNKM